jgi:hypothetical protein
MKKIITIILTIFCTSLFSEVYSFRQCTLLPITDSVGGAIGFKVFSKIEENLKENKWCTYHSNSNLLSTFAKYRENLPTYLKNPEVIKTVAEKLKSGSIIKISMTKEINTIEIELEVLGQNGEDLLFSEKTVLQKDDMDLITSQLTSWLEIYSKIIPYDGIVTGILGDQITIDSGKNYSIKPGQEFVVKRVTSSKTHPLLKKIVEWNTNPIGTGKIFSVSEMQALGQVQVYIEQGKNIKIGDWIRLEALKSTKLTEDEEREGNEFSFGKLGVASAYFTLSATSYSASATTNNRMAGNLLGVDLRAEAWLTRNYFGLFQIAKNLGSVKKASGNPSESRLDASNTSFKFGGGYKFLPLGFFYGPQIDGYLAYSKQTFGIQSASADGYGEVAMKGLVLGLAANLPLNRTYRIQSRAEFMPMASFDDVETTYGSINSENWLQIEFGVKKQQTNNLTLDALIEMTSANATFEGDISSFSYKDTQLKMGASFNY